MTEPIRRARLLTLAPDPGNTEPGNTLGSEPGNSPGNTPGNGHGNDLGNTIVLGNADPGNGPGNAILPVMLTGIAPWPIPLRFAKWFSRRPAWAQSIAWPFARLAFDIWHGTPKSMFDYSAGIKSHEWVHPELAGWRAKFVTLAGLGYHHLIGRPIAAAALAVAGCAQRPHRLALLILVCALLAHIL
jgi:hypothetical protein